MKPTDWQLLALAAFLFPVATTGLLLAGSRGHWEVVLAAAGAVIIVLVARLRRHRIRPEVSNRGRGK